MADQSLKERTRELWKADIPSEPFLEARILVWRQLGLELVAEIERLEAERVCEWAMFFDPDYLQSACGEEFVPEIVEDLKSPNCTYQFCPGCGGKIQLKEEETEE